METPYSNTLIVQGREIPSQDVTVVTQDEFEQAKIKYLKYLVYIWSMVEEATGFKWRATSWIRNSPSHKEGYALDLAPDIHPSSEHLYAVTKMSDPVLYKRASLIYLLRDAINLLPSHFPYSVGIFIEPDHLHVELITKSIDAPYFRLFKWGTLKPCYSDTASRSKLPLITT